MTNDNNKFAPKPTDTYTVAYLETNQAVKKSNLSAAARSKVINRSGSNYVSKKEGYRPCYRQIAYRDCNCGFSITAVLTDINGNSRHETIFPTSNEQIEDLQLSITIGLGNWASAGDRFSPSHLSRQQLAHKVRGAVSFCGPQTVAMVDMTYLQRILG